MTGHVRAWLGWWAVCAGIWLMLVDRVPLAELLLGAGVAALGATAAVLVRRERQVVLRLRPGWALAALRPVASLVGDLVPLVRVLVTRGALRRDGGGRTVELPFAQVGEGRDETSYRVLTETLGSLGPNTIVVDVDRARGVLTAHQLDPTDDVAQRAMPLRGDAP